MDGALNAAPDGHPGRQGRVRAHPRCHQTSLRAGPAPGNQPPAGGELRQRGIIAPRPTG
jgi:hypothetical protein